MDDASRLFLVVAADERAGLLRDGLAREVLPGVLVAVDVPVTEGLRDWSIRQKLGHWETDAGRGRAVGYSTAAWVYTGRPAPLPDPPHLLDLVIGRNRRSPRLPEVRVRQVDVPAEQLQIIEGLQVTRPVRTAADLARDLPGPEAVPLLQLLQELHDVHPPQVLEVLASMPYARGAAVARKAVRAWADGA